jgi:hypothetical protein
MRVISSKGRRRKDERTISGWIPKDHFKGRETILPLFVPVWAAQVFWEGAGIFPNGIRSVDLCDQLEQTSQPVTECEIGQPNKRIG